MDQLLAGAVEARNLVLVVGTGASAYTTGGSPEATWVGFLRSGIEIGRRIEPDGETWARLQEALLDFGVNHSTLPELLTVASSVAGRVKGTGAQGLYNWLRDTVGALSASRTDLTRVLTDLPYPIATTNYDSLLDQARGAAVWTNPSSVQAALSGTSSQVIHLHGLWTQPDSAIITDADYQRLLRSETAQDLQRAASSTKSLVYVGYGSGLADPNFSRLIEWHRDSFVPSPVPHFRLCRNSELEELRALHAGDHIHPVAYGERYEDLPAFIEQLRPKSSAVSYSEAGIARDVVGDSQVVLSAELVRDSIIGETLPSLNEKSINEVILPPVLLPVPHAEYIRARRSKSGATSVGRLDPLEELRGADVIVLVGDENSGLTTAVKWMAVHAATYIGGVPPIYLSFRSCKPSATPLGDQLAGRAKSLGLIRDKQDEIPPFVLALDDFSPYVQKISDRVFAELTSTQTAIYTIIGCLQGTEDDVVDRLTRAGVQPVVRYLGRLSASDVRSLARMASPTNADELAERVLDLIQSENLPRTPSSAGLLLSVLIRTGLVSTSTSQTAILDDYVGLILGRGDPHEDARIGLEQTGREALLARIAEAFVLADAGGLSESEVVASLQATFDTLGWHYSPTQVLQNLVDRRILKREGKHITFVRSSYLHLFIAKRATVDSAFRSRLLQNPLYYSTALSDYAALFRHDRELVAEMGQLLDGDEWEASSQGVFDEIPTEDADIAAQAVDNTSADEPTMEVGRTPARRDTATKDLFFDHTDDDDRPPFPINEETEISAALKLMRTLELVSQTLRDSDQVEDLVLKQKVLLDTLEHWGVFMSMMSEDGGMTEFLVRLLEETREAVPDDPEAFGEILEEWRRVFPAAVALGGITVSLASRRLTIALDRAVTDGSVFSTEARVVGAAFFIFALQDDGWVRRLQVLLKDQRNIWVVRNFLLFLCLKAYCDDAESVSEEDALLELCIDITQRAYRFPNEAAKRDHRERLRTDFLRRRIRARTERAVSRNPSGDDDA